MSFTREMYDKCAQRQRLTQDKRIQDHIMYPGQYNNSAKCRMEQGILGGRPDSLYTGNLVDLESDLRGQTRPLSQCPSQQFRPGPDPLLRNVTPCHPGIVQGYNGGVFRR